MLLCGYNWIGARSIWELVSIPFSYSFTDILIQIRLEVVRSCYDLGGKWRAFSTKEQALDYYAEIYEMNGLKRIA